MIIEPIDKINKRLEDHFGKDDLNRSIWRVVWSDEQFEKQLLTHTPEGLELIHPKWYEVPKYKMMGVKERYVLERLVIVPVQNAHELTTKVSYEPMWVFEDKNGFPLPPKYEACELVINTVYAAMGKRTSEKLYHDPEEGKTTPELIYEHNERVKKLQQDLFGNETKETDAVRVGEGVFVPSNYGDKQ